MKIAYFDCLSGISGDMTLAALIDAGIDVAVLQTGIDSLGLPDCQIVVEEVKKKGFRATNIKIVHPEQHAHRHLHHITEMIDQSSISESQKELAKRIFTKLGEAEAKVHGTTLRKVHFHEVGAVDSIADIVGAAIGLDLLGVEKVFFSHIPTGCGTIDIAHGRVSIPAPATAELLRGIPITASGIEAELTTPTGAAIASTVGSGFGPMPSMRIERIGFGAGDRDLDQQANVLRLFVGNDDHLQSAEQIWVLETNLDDLPGEIVGYTTTRLLEAGALDVYTTPIQMKKNRPAVKVSVLCSVEKIDELETILFRETSTLGIRRWAASRSCLKRESTSIDTQWGTIAGKVAWLKDGERLFAPEYESCIEIAQSNQIALREVFAAARMEYERQQPVSNGLDSR